jgi:hypothetical protein
VPRFGVRRRGIRTGLRRALSDQEAGGGAKTRMFLGEIRLRNAFWSTGNMRRGVPSLSKLVEEGTRELACHDGITQGPLRPGGRWAGAKIRKFLGGSSLRNAFWSTGNMRRGAPNLSKLVEAGTRELAYHDGITQGPLRPGGRRAGAKIRKFLGENRLRNARRGVGSMRGGATHLPKPVEVGTWELLACRVTVQENPEGHLSGRQQGEPACASVGVEERIFCGLGVWPEMKMFAVACWCRSFSSGFGVEERIFCGPGVWPEMKMFAVACGCCSFSGGMVDREPRGFLNANLCVNQYIKNVCDVFYNFCAEGHGHEVFRPQWRGETVDDAVGSPSLQRGGVL